MTIIYYEVAMPKFVIEFSSRDATAQRIKSLADEQGITPEQLIHRAIGDYLGGYGLKLLSQDFVPKSLDNLFTKKGILKDD